MVIDMIVTVIGTRRFFHLEEVRVRLKWGLLADRFFGFLPIIVCLLFNLNLARHVRFVVLFCCCTTAGLE